MTYSYLLCGVGGQGTVLASKLLAECAIARGQMARTAETIGMAQRGGCVVSHVRIGDAVHSPLIPLGTADVLIGFEPAEAVRCLPYLKPDGAVIVSQKAVMPVTATLGGSPYCGTEMLDYLKQNCKNLFVIDTEAICTACGSTKILNVALLGAAAESGMLGITGDELEQALTRRIPEKFLALNMTALHAGADAAKGQKGATK